MLRVMLFKEVILLWRDKQALAALFIMPAIFILIMSMALKDTMGGERSLASYAAVDLDDTVESGRLLSFLAENKGLEEQLLTISTVAEQQEALNGTVQFVLSIPRGFAKNLGKEQSGPGLLQLTVAPDVKGEVLAFFQGELIKGIMRLRLEKMEEELAPFLPEVANRLETMDSDGEGLLTVRFRGGEASEQPTSTQQSVPSWIVFGMFFVIIPMSTVFINERRQNTLMRMKAMNLSVPLLFAGKIVPYMLINQIQVWLMIAVGLFIVPLCGGDALTLGDSITGLVMVSLGLSLAAIGTSMLIAVMAATVEQATTIGGIINILLGAIGGIMVPKFYMPQVMQKLAAVSPMSWGLEGFLDIFLRGLGAEAVLLESLALAGFGLGLLFTAAMVFRFKMRRGV